MDAKAICTFYVLYILYTRVFYERWPDRTAVLCGIHQDKNDKNINFIKKKLFRSSAYSHNYYFTIVGQQICNAIQCSSRRMTERESIQRFVSSTIYIYSIAHIHIYILLWFCKTTTPKRKEKDELAHPTVGFLLSPWWWNSLCPAFTLEYDCESLRFFFLCVCVFWTNYCTYVLLRMNIYLLT
jgi:hypothetical protein